MCIRDRDKRFDGLFLLPAAQTRDKNAVSPKQMQDLCKELKEQFDYILIDCPAGIEQGFKNAVAGADKAIVAVSYTHLVALGAGRVVEEIETLKKVALSSKNVG